jgi:hypothetical protein
MSPLADRQLLTCSSEKAKSIIRNNKQTQAKSANVSLIPKPPGRRSRDFNIFDEMKANGKVKITKATYKNLIVSRLGGLHLSKHANFWWQNSIHLAVESSGFDMSLPLREQETVELAKVIAYVRQASLHTRSSCFQ